VIAGFYVRRSRSRGVGTPIRPYVIVGVVVAVLTAALTLWLAFHPLIPLTAGPLNVTPAVRFVHGLATPMTAIGLALLMLVWVERNGVLLAYSLVYLVIVMVQAAEVIHSHSQWYFLPNLIIPAAVLLAGSAGFALFQSRTERSPR